MNTLEGVQTLGKGSIFAFASSQICTAESLDYSVQSDGP